MGDYTKFVFDARILPGNEEVHTFFNYFRVDKHVMLPSHPFFDTPRWHMLLRGGSGYHYTQGFNYFVGDDIDPPTVHISSSFKHYGDEIEYFCAWAKEWAEPEYVYGYALDEYSPPKWIVTDYDFDSQPIVLKERL